MGRRDVNERAIVDGLRDIGLTVARLPGDGLPDLLIGMAGQNYLHEVKGPDGKLTEAQLRWISKWQGEIAIVSSLEESLQALGLLPGGSPDGRARSVQEDAMMKIRAQARARTLYK
jgi:hypothetical protein